MKTPARKIVSAFAVTFGVLMLSAFAVAVVTFLSGPAIEASKKSGDGTINTVLFCINALPGVAVVLALFRVWPRRGGSGGAAAFDVLPAAFSTVFFAVASGLLADAGFVYLLAAKKENAYLGFIHLPRYLAGWWPHFEWGNIGLFAVTTLLNYFPLALSVLLGCLLTFFIMPKVRAQKDRASPSAGKSV